METRMSKQSIKGACPADEGSDTYIGEKTVPDNVTITRNSQVKAYGSRG